MPPALCCFDGLFAQTAVVWQNRHRIAANWARLAVPSGFRVPAEVPPMDAVLCIRGTGAVAGSVHKGSGGGDGTFLFCQKGQQAADKGGVGALDTLEGPARKALAGGDGNDRQGIAHIDRRKLPFITAKLYGGAAGILGNLKGGEALVVDEGQDMIFNNCLVEPSSINYSQYFIKTTGLKSVISCM